jgi:hypothetical protein
MVVAVVWTQKVGAMAIGLAFIVAGAAFIKFGGPAMNALNRLNAQLPGKIAYPSWWHRAFGAMIVAFGLLVACVGGALAGR